MIHISQEDARRAIELLVRVSDRSAGLDSDGDDQRHERLDTDVVDFLYDEDSGDMRFDERDEDPSPLCRCETCPMGGPFTCISED